ncbi:MAG: Lrp/AsnC family transcriptional regulator [Burkholderiaceae bacterium]
MEIPPDAGAHNALDRTDRRILEILRRDGRISNLDLAQQVALSPAPCLRRVRRLEQAGVIRGYHADVDPAALGLTLLAFVNVKLAKQGAGRERAPDAEFAEAVAQWEEVVECHALTGDLDYLLKVRVRHLDHFSSFMMERLLRQPAVLDVRSSFALKSIKTPGA